MAVLYEGYGFFDLSSPRTTHTPVTAREHLVIFARYPEPGSAGAQLVSALGEQGAADLIRSLTEQTLSTVRSFVRGNRAGRSVEIRFDGGGRDRMLAWLGNGIVYTPHRSPDTKERLIGTLADAFEAGAESVMILNAACPTLSNSHLDTAHAALRTGDLVIGPAGESGCYLIGLTRTAQFHSLTALFSGVAWGSGYASGDLVSNAANLGLTYRLLERLPEVETPEDLVVWDRARLSGQAGKPLLLSIVIPTLNDEHRIGRTLESLMSGRELEVIVADGGSTDATVLAAISYDAHIVEAPPGYASRLKAGAAEAAGVFLLFIQPGALLEPGFDRAVRDMLTNPGIVCGTFTRRTDSRQFRHRIIDRLAQFGTTMLHLPTVDQGLFMRTDTFHQVDGISERHVMPALGLARRLGRLGKVTMSPLRVLVPLKKNP